jgi:hypothetical protein
MKQIIVEGITSKGKRAVSKHGALWDLHAKTNLILFFPEIGPWLYISPPGEGHTSKRARWVKETNDKDFRITYNGN